MVNAENDDEQHPIWLDVSQVKANKVDIDVIGLVAMQIKGRGRWINFLSRRFHTPRRLREGEPRVCLADAPTWDKPYQKLID